MRDLKQNIQTSSTFKDLRTQPKPPSNTLKSGGGDVNRFEPDLRTETVQTLTKRGNY